MQKYDVVIIGAGFSGIYAIHRLRKRYNVICLEAGDGVGGTWYWNRYPGCRVDVESVQYSYGFDEDLQQEWSWSERFAAQPDLEAYANHVVDRFGLREHIKFSCPATAMKFDASTNRWRVSTGTGEEYECHYVIAATGALYAPYTPDWQGFDDFKGQLLHSTAWPKEEVDFTGKKVGIVGTGATAIQIAPIAAEKAERLYVFQRTPIFSLPSSNGPMDPVYEQEWKANYAERRKMQLDTWGATIIHPNTDKSIHDVSVEERERILESAWNSANSFQLLLSFPDVITDVAGNELVSEFARNKIRSIVKDPVIAEKLCPTTYPFGAKRIGVDSGYFQIYNRDNVELVDIREAPVEKITGKGLKTTDNEYELDILILATGFDAITGSLSRIDITGPSGVKLADKWKDHVNAYLGYTIAGFPNLFTIHGPGSPSSQANMIPSGVWQVDWISDLIDDSEDKGFERVEASPEAEREWSAEVEKTSHLTLHRTADTWANGSNIPGKSRDFLVYVGGFPLFRSICEGVAADGYRGFVRS